MRGKGCSNVSAAACAGITPAYAGKSSCLLRLSDRLWDHPRVCGEKKIERMVFMMAMGSPPRMRGKGTYTVYVGSANRITPAYAGKRQVINFMGALYKDHPRVCGEKTKKIP